MREVCKIQTSSLLKVRMKSFSLPLTSLYPLPRIKKSSRWFLKGDFSFEGLWYKIRNSIFYGYPYRFQLSYLILSDHILCLFATTKKSLMAATSKKISKAWSHSYATRTSLTTNDEEFIENIPQSITQDKSEAKKLIVDMWYLIVNKVYEYQNWNTKRCFEFELEKWSYRPRSMPCLTKGGVKERYHTQKTEKDQKGNEKFEG